MRKPAKLLVTASAIAALVGSLAIAPELSAADKKMTPAQQGKKIAENRKKGNCFACHAYAGVKMAGDIGPPLVAMKARYPDRAKLRMAVWDATKRTPTTMMPPFGRHEILTEKEIDYIVDWLYTL